MLYLVYLHIYNNPSKNREELIQNDNETTNRTRKPQKKSQEKRVEKEGFCKDGKLRKERFLTVFTGIRDQLIENRKKRPIEAYV